MAGSMTLAGSARHVIQSYETSVDFSSGSLRQRSWKSPSEVQKSERKDASGASACSRGTAGADVDRGVPGVPSEFFGSGTYT